MKITFLGTGTSQGIPVINCNCSVCKSGNPRNKRTRTSILVEERRTSLLIDATVDFRLQALENKISHLDGIFFTHAHADHVFGLDDIRVFTPQNSSALINCYGNRITIAGIRRIFKYAFSRTQEGGGKPHLNLKVVSKNFCINDMEIIPVPVKHGGLDILGCRINGFAYITDASYIGRKSMGLLTGIDVMVLNALRHEPHPTHFSVSEALEIVKKIKPSRVYFTHICHKLEHEKTNRMLPDGIALAYDGMKLNI